MMQVRTVFKQEPIEVPDDEAEVLRAQGLLVEDTKPAPRTAPAATPKES